MGIAAHPAFWRSLVELREMGVLLGSYEPHRPKAGGGADRFHWEEGSRTRNRARAGLSCREGVGTRRFFVYWWYGRHTPADQPK